MNISHEAVEAAAKALDPQTMGSGGALAEKFQEATRAEARRILEAAAPYLKAEALRDAAEELDAGIVYGWDSDRQYADYLRSKADEVEADRG